ncbi:MAG: tetratricopeptide repeat protein [Candidatus Pacebacteria bacterium]|nr:tetratricopeptide repeat protein [Candidatus Paceibacterota bacterium]
MKLITRLLTRIYQYTTVLVVVAAPLFFIPKTGFSGEATYHIAMMVLVAIALAAYVGNAFVTKTWHTVSKLEFLSYFAFTGTVLLSVVFSNSPKVLLFGDGLNQFSGVAMLTLPAVMYLVRALPETLRHKLKFVTLGVLAASSLVFVFALMFGGKLLEVARVIFSGFSSSVSFAAYIGLFAVAAFFYVRKATLKKRYKVFILITGLLFVAWAVTLSTQNSVRPNLKSTLLVGKSVMLEDGVFGIGPGNFSRAWQLHRPQDVINSQFFGYEFLQGADTISTFFVTVGLLGTLAFLLMIFSALYSTFVSYKQNKEGQEHIILGLIFMTLLYFIGVSLLVPLSYSMLVMWMIISGLGIARARLTEFHPNKKLSYLLIPLAIILIVNAFVTINKARAFATYNKAQTATSVEQAESLTKKALNIYHFDGFYRVLVEYAITSNRNLVSTESSDQEDLKNKYLVKSQEAVDAALAAVKINPNNYQNFVSLGRAYELAVPFDKAGGFDNAKKSYDEAIKLYPGNPYLYLMQARLETSAGTKDAAKERLTEALSKKQNFADALYLMSQLSAGESKIEEAINYAVEAVRSAPNDPLVYTQAGLLFYAKRDYQNAVLALRGALERDPNNENVAYFLALSLRDGGNGAAAIPLAEELLKRNPNNQDIKILVSSLKSVAPAKTEDKSQ